MKAYEIGTYRGYLTRMNGKKLPVQLAFAIGMNADELDEWAKKIDAQRIKLAEQYCKRSKGGEPVTVTKDGRTQYDFTPANLKAFQADYDELLESDIDISIRKVSATELDKLEQARYDALTVGEIKMLGFMIEEK